MFLFQKIEEVTVQNDSRAAIAKFILEEKDNLNRLNLSEIAKRTYTSNATLVRFAKSLGYDGWKSFMKDFVEELNHEKRHQKDVDANIPFKEGDALDEIINNLMFLQMETIEDTIEMMNPVMIEQATDILIRAKRIVLYGTSPNCLVGELFRRKMTTIGKSVEIGRQGEYGILTKTLGKEDCAIIISYSGNNKDAAPMCYIKTLKEQQVPIIGITSGGDNYIHQMLDCVLVMSTKERLYSKIANFSTEESLNFIFNVLFSNCFARNYRKNLNFKIYNARSLEQSRQTKLALVREVDS